MNRAMTFVEQGSVRFERFDMGGKAVLWVIRPGESSADQDWDAREHIGVVNTPGAFGAVDAGFGVPGLLPLPDLENYDEEHPCLDRAALTQLLTQYIRWDELPNQADLPAVYYHRKLRAAEGGPTGGICGICGAPDTGVDESRGMNLYLGRVFDFVESVTRRRIE